MQALLPAAPRRRRHHGLRAPNSRRGRLSPGFPGTIWRWWWPHGTAGAVGDLSYDERELSAPRSMRWRRAIRPGGSAGAAHPRRALLAGQKIPPSSCFRTAASPSSADRQRAARAVHGPLRPGSGGGTTPGTPPSPRSPCAATAANRLNYEVLISLSWFPAGPLRRAMKGRPWARPRADRRCPGARSFCRGAGGSSTRTSPVRRVRLEARLRLQQRHRRSAARRPRPAVLPEPGKRRVLIVTRSSLFSRGATGRRAGAKNHLVIDRGDAGRLRPERGALRRGDLRRLHASGEIGASACALPGPAGGAFAIAAATATLITDVEPHPVLSALGVIGRCQHVREARCSSWRPGSTACWRRCSSSR